MKQHRMTDSEILVYIENMLQELGKLAKNSNNALLAYMIGMASQEARERIEEKKNH